MKILLILPNKTSKVVSKNKQIFLTKIFISEKSSTLMILAALIPEKHSVEVVEDNFRNIEFDKNYDIVGISFVTRDAILGYQIADEFRKQGKTVVLGGWHPTVMPEEAKQHADSVVIGEAEETWPQMLKDMENGKLKPFYTPTRAVDPKLIPPPRTDVYPKGTRIDVQATRGCPYGCLHCAITNSKFRNIFRTKPIPDVIEEIRSLPNKIFYFHDNSLTINKEYAKHLFKEMKGLGKKFIAYGNIGTLGRDDELLRLASEAGCIIWRVGFESISQETLDSIDKKTNIIEEYISAIKKIHDHGAMVRGNFIFGFDTDTLDVFDETEEFVHKSEIDVPWYHILTPFPGTPLYDRLDREGRILTRDWNKYDTHRSVIFQPKHMTPEELLTNTIRIRNKTYKISRAIERMIKSSKIGLYPFIETTMMNISIISWRPTNLKISAENHKKKFIK
jgi:radical SAM superfamily enzyme YgiQ (UPF0313 family)